MRKIILGSIALMLCIITDTGLSQVVLPTPDHIVVVIMENHGYDQIIGSSAANYINSLVQDPDAASFTQSFAIEHPSQPNYLDFFSGCNQDVTDDNLPTNLPFTTDNLAAQLIHAGKTFTTFSEDLPLVGYNGASYGNYARKHNPAANWIGTATNQIPPTTNQPLTSFPSDYTKLPTFCYVVPNQNDDMHNGSDPKTITAGDNWVKNHLDAYVQWAKTHNSLLILTFDEDDNGPTNQIVTIFIGQMVKHGLYDETINHYSVIRTIEDIYGLPYACNAAAATTISNAWTISSGVAEAETLAGGKIFTCVPNPANKSVTIRIDNKLIGKLQTLEIHDNLGRKVFSRDISKSNSAEFQAQSLTPGNYFVRIGDGHSYYIQKLIVQ